VIVHVKKTRHLHLLLGDIRRSGARAGVALNPTPQLSAIANVVDLLDPILVMTINPGFGGQAFIGSMLAKGAEARALLDEAESLADLEVDGGVSATAGELVNGGVSVLVAGSAAHRHPGGREAGIRELREAAVRG
jgi:ribulose-phosphate 3-epimerase